MSDMTWNDVVDLLTLAAAYDRRTAGEPDIHAWHDAATRGRWRRDEAFDAVKAHYATSTAWLMPGHVTETIRANRRQPAPIRDVLPALPPAEQATAEQRAAAIQTFADGIGRRKGIPS